MTFSQMPEFREWPAFSCTGCGKCSGCPMELDIPVILAAANAYLQSGAAGDLRPILDFPGDRQPKACVGCGQCAAHCPEHIDVPGCMLKLCPLLEQVGK